MSPRPDVLPRLTDNYCKIACLAGRFARRHGGWELQGWPDVVASKKTKHSTRRRRMCTVQSQLDVPLNNLFVRHCRHRIPKKNFTFTDRISRKHLLSTFRLCLCEGYDDCQHERQHNLAYLFVVFVKERTMFGERDQVLL